MSAVVLLVATCLVALALHMWAARVLRRMLDDVPEQEPACEHEAFMDGRCMVCGTPTDSIQVYREPRR